MIYVLMGYAHAAIVQRMRAIQKLATGERGQGTVEYVGLILLVSLLMVGMVAAMKGFNRYLSKIGYQTRQPSSSFLTLIRLAWRDARPAICRLAAGPANAVPMGTATKLGSRQEPLHQSRGWERR
jgi:hypothetical protein